MRLPPQQSSHTKSQLLVWPQLDPEDPDLISDFICDGFLIWWHHWEVIEHLSWVLEGESQSLRECHRALSGWPQVPQFHLFSAS